MKSIGLNDTDQTLLVLMSQDEFKNLQSALGIDYNNRTCKPGTVIDTKPLYDISVAISTLQNFSRDFENFRKVVEKIQAAVNISLGKNEIAKKK